MNTLLYAQLLYEIISLQNIMSKKRTFTFTLFVDFLSTPAFLVPTPDSVQPNTRRDTPKGFNKLSLNYLSQPDGLISNYTPRIKLRLQYIACVQLYDIKYC